MRWLGIALILFLATSLAVSFHLQASAPIARIESPSALTPRQIQGTPTCGYEFSPLPANEATAVLDEVAGIWRNSLGAISVEKDPKGVEQSRVNGLLIGGMPQEFTLANVTVEPAIDQAPGSYISVSAQPLKKSARVEVGPLSEDGFRVVQVEFDSTCITYALKYTTLEDGNEALLMRSRQIVSSRGRPPVRSFLEARGEDIEIYIR